MGKLRLGQKKQDGGMAAFVTGAALGVVFFLLLYGPSTLNPTYDSWIYCGYIEKDIVQSYAGWLYFRASPWDWPPTVAQNLGVPYGTSIVFTDSTPLLALLFKVLSPLLPATFQYLGWQNLLNCALQGGFGLLLLRRFALGWAPSVLGCALFLCTPVFVERLFRHSALGSQWLILAALLFYFEARRTLPAAGSDSASRGSSASQEEKSRLHVRFLSMQGFPYVGFFVLCVLAPAIHTYFLPLVYALLLAALMDRVVRTRRVLAPAGVLAACFAGTLACMYPLGILTRGGGGGGSDYGRYSMNLNAILNPRSVDFFAGDKTLAWSRILPVRPQAFYQYDGFAYLGFGLLLGIAAMFAYGGVRLVLSLRRHDRAVLRRAQTFVVGHIPLLGVVLALAVFAVSRVAVWDETVLYTLPLPEFVLRLCSIFRASGRMFWLCIYLATLSVVVWAGRLSGRVGRVGGGTLLLAAVLGLQVWDTGGVLAQKHRYFHSGVLVCENDFSTDAWRAVCEHYDNVVFLNNVVDYDLDISFVRYNPKVTTNMILANRGNFQVILGTYALNIEALRAGTPLADGTLYVLDDADTFAYIMEGAHADARGYRVGDYYLIANPYPGMPLAPCIPA